MKNILFSVAKSRTKFLILLLIIEMIILSLSSPYFLNIKNIIEITQFGAILMLLSIGESLVILSGNDGIDLSIGAVLSLSGVFFGLSIKAGASIPVAVFLTILSGVIVGSLNGFLVAFIRLPALLATLGTQYIFGSIALFLTNGIPISGFPESFKFLSLQYTFGIPNQILYVVIPVTIVMMILIYKNKFGRRIYMIGSNQIAAKFAGIHEDRIRFAIFVIVGVLASLGAIINCSWLMTSRADAGSGLEMQAISVAVLGGIAIEGGSGKLGSVIIGVIIITMLNSGLQIANVNSIWQLAVLGIVLIISVAFNHLMSKLASKTEKNK